MAISLDTTLTVTHNIVEFNIDPSGGALLTVSSKPAGKQANRFKVTLDAAKTDAVMSGTPDNTKNRADDLEYAFLITLRDNGYL